MAKLIKGLAMTTQIESSAASQQKKGSGVMTNHYLNTFEASLNASKQDMQKMTSFLENTDFFLKLLTLKLESNDPLMQKQGLEELKEFQLLLKTHQKIKCLDKENVQLIL